MPLRVMTQNLRKKWSGLAVRQVWHRCVVVSMHVPYALRVQVSRGYFRASPDGTSPKVLLRLRGSERQDERLCRD
jgi:hypothetical protein